VYSTDFTSTSVGDVIDVWFALMLIKMASKVDSGLPPAMYAKMTTNIVLDFVIGLVPFLGDFGDAFFRANTRNAWLLDAYLHEKYLALEKGETHDPDDPESGPVAVNHETLSTPLPTDSEKTPQLPPRPPQAHSTPRADGSMMEEGVMQAPLQTNPGHHAGGRKGRNKGRH
jgi:hypothetical protein